jgi:hypothetical protein
MSNDEQYLNFIEDMSAIRPRKNQIPPDLVVKSQAVDITEVI